MIGYLRGTILSKGANYLILETGNVGYRVFVPSNILLKYKSGSELALFIFSYIREDQFSLYGFLSQDELDLFELLLTVSGVGPKVALGIMSGVSTGHVKSAIAGGEAAVFTKVSGVGRKTAERIIIELREKIGGGALGDVNVRSSREYSESLDALVALGYSQAEAREALKQIPADLADSGQIVKAALKILAGR